ncbi:MAG TPA: hypothetical protein VFW64_21610 [Pseudonocardiaceae bacterium]|nr:hypothetical protein [Pseudonocardiaceae bacterium]
MTFEIPASCTLSTAQLPIRADEFGALLATSLRAERLDERRLRVSFAGGATKAAAVRDLAARETACCSFFELTVSTVADRVLLDVQVPAARVGVLDGLAGLATVNAQ